MTDEIRYRIGIDGARETQQVLQGLRKEASEAQKAARAAAETARAAPTPANNAAAGEARALANRKAAVAQYEAWRRGEEARTARERDGHLRAAVKAEQQAAQGRMQAIQSYATRALAVYRTVSERASALSGAFGGRSREGMLTEQMGFETNLVRFSRDTGINRAGARRSIIAAARASGMDPSQVLAGMSAGADVAGDAGGAALMRNATAIARTAQALGTTTEAIATPLGQALNRGMDERSVDRFLSRYASIATASRIAPEEFSGRLGSAIAGMATLTGAGGEEAVLRTMQMQGVVAGAFSGQGRQAGAKYDQIMSMLGDTGFQRRMQRVTGSTGTLHNRVGGTLADPLSTLQSLQGSGALVTNEQFARLAGSPELGAALQTVVQGMRDPNNGAIRDALAASESGGRDYVEGTMRDLQGVAGFGNQADQMSTFLENGQDFARYADTMADSVDGLNARFPLAVEGVDNFSGAIEKLIGLMGGVGLMQGAAGVGSVVGGGGALFGGGGAAAGGGIASTVGGGLAAVGGGSAAVGGAAVAGVIGAPVMAGYIVNRHLDNLEAERRFEAEGGETERALGPVRRDIERQASTHRNFAQGFVGLSGNGPAAPSNLSGPPRAAAVAAASPGPGGAGFGGFLGAGGGSGRPASVALDRGSIDQLSTGIASRIAASGGRGESERR